MGLQVICSVCKNPIRDEDSYATRTSIDGVVTTSHSSCRVYEFKKQNANESFGIYRAEWLRLQKIKELSILFNDLGEGLNKDTRFVNVKEGHYPPGFYGIIDVFGLGLGFDKERNILFWEDKK